MLGDDKLIKAAVYRHCPGQGCKLHTIIVWCTLAGVRSFIGAHYAGLSVQCGCKHEHRRVISWEWAYQIVSLKQAVLSLEAAAA